MIKDQGTEKDKFKPVNLALIRIFTMTFSLFTINYAYALDASTTNTMTSSPSSPLMTEPASTSTSGMISPPPTSTSTTVTTRVKTIPANSDSNKLTTSPMTTDVNAPLDKPNISDAALLAWAADAAKSAYSYDFKNYAKQLQNNQPNFTSSGWNAFMSALDKSQNLQIVQDKKLVASATVTGVPIILNKGVRNGLYYWEIQIPLLATYESESRLIKQNLMVDMLITRMNTPIGIGINHFMARVVPSNQPMMTSPSSGVTPPTTATNPSTSPITTTNQNAAPVTTPTVTSPSTTIESTTTTTPTQSTTTTTAPITSTPAPTQTITPPTTTTPATVSPSTTPNTTPAGGITPTAPVNTPYTTSPTTGTSTGNIGGTTP